MKSLKNKLKKIDAMLIEKALHKAHRQFDEHNVFRYGNMKGRNLTPAERDDLNMYLFGDRYKDATVEELRALP